MLVVVQKVEHLTVNQKVVGSYPIRGSHTVSKTVGIGSKPIDPDLWKVPRLASQSSLKMNMEM